jgi:hypothetical protein
LDGVETVPALTSAVVSALILAMLAAIFFLPARVDLDVEGDTLVVRPRELDVLWTLRRRIDVPLSMVGMVRVVPRSQTPRQGLRWPGTSLPQAIRAGSYGTGEERTFWDVRRADRVLLISLRLGFEYKSLVLEVPDPDAVAARLNKALVAR